jgi:hypothetical protein
MPSVCMCLCLVYYVCMYACMDVLRASTSTPRLVFFMFGIQELIRHRSLFSDYENSSSKNRGP